MPTFRYRQGDRPLDGYTIEHGVGRGGFGEVYYAVSDSGRQVALKSVHQYEDIELRGISHCMNLKSPHLVSIFDVKHSERNEPFVIMEYVAGPSLRELLDEHPNGMGGDKAAFFVREIAKGLTLLHEAGVVHRDLKPHNIFYEDGYVKIGDYSLSKVITASHRSGHTLTVGTVHYMAPEIGMGNYDHTVDIYALGILLYEMLKGVPPYQGESMGEVLMKHMSHEVDMTGIEEPYATVIRNALAKDPKERYQTAEEMVEDLFGVDHVRESVTVFNPQSLTIVAERAKIPLDKPTSNPAAVAGPRPVPVTSNDEATLEYENHRYSDAAWDQMRREHGKVARSIGRFSGRVAAASAVMPFPFADRARREKDPLGFIHRVLLTLACLFIVSLAGAEGGYYHEIRDPGEYFGGFLVLLGGIFVLTKFVTMPLLNMNSFLHRIAFGGTYLLMSLICEETFGMRQLANSMYPCVFAILLLDLRWLCAPVRPKRIRLTPVLFAAFISMIASISTVGDNHVSNSVALIIGITLGLQVISNFDPVASREIEKSTHWFQAFGDLVTTWYGWRFGKQRSKDSRTAAQRAGEAVGKIVRPIQSAASSFGQSLKEQVETFKSQIEDARKQRKEAEFDVNNNDQFNPAARIHPVDVLVDDGHDIALEGFHADDSVHGAVGERQAPASTSENSVAGQDGQPELPRRSVALLLSLIPFLTLGMLPVCGLHRFYTGRKWTGILWLLTMGLCGVGQIVDLVMMALGEFEDGHGRNLVTGLTRSETQAEPVNGLSTVPNSHQEPGRKMVVLSGVMIVFTLFLGTFLAADPPRMIEAGVFQELDLSKAEVERSFGDLQSWQEMLFDVLLLFTCMVGLSTLAVLMVSRARHGFLHMFRGLLAGGGFLAYFCVFHLFAERINWEQLVRGFETERIGLILDATIGRHSMIPMLIVSGLIMFCTVVMLAIPPRKAKTRVIKEVTRLVEQEV